MVNTIVKFVGTGLGLTLSYSVSTNSTGTDLKRLLLDEFGLPLTKQTLTLVTDDGDAGDLLEDDSSLADHGIGGGGATYVMLDVEVDGDKLMTVNLVSSRYPKWKEVVHCSEATTVSELKTLVGNTQGWYDGDLGGMELSEAVRTKVMDVDDAGLASYLVVDGGTVDVIFRNRLIPDVLPIDYDHTGDSDDEE